MPIVPDTLAAADACIYAWAKGKTGSNDSVLSNLGILKAYAEQIPEDGVRPCTVCYVLEPIRDIYALNLGSMYKETVCQMLVAAHAPDASDATLVMLAAAQSRIRKIFELTPPDTNAFGMITNCFYLKDWKPPFDDVEGHLYAARGVVFEVWLQRARLA